MKRYVWEVSWRLNKDWNILTPSSSGYSNISFPFSWAAQPGAWGPSLCWVWFSLLELEHWLQTLISNWSNFSVAPGYIIVFVHLLPVASQFALNSTRRQSRLSLISSTGCTCYVHRCISYFDCSAGSEVNMLHIYKRWTIFFGLFLIL